MNVAIRELNAVEAASVAGGYDDIPFCGTVPHHFPFPPRPWFIDLNLPVIINTPFGG